jgi:transcriptional regulator with XRE-family HTH domain
MKDRIAHIMRAKNLKASDFATMLGIQPSAVSHILAGRNKPSLEIVRKIKETFPEYNLDWIILGSGPMTTSEPFKESVQEPSFNFTPLPDDNPSESLVIPQTDSQNDALVESGIKTMVILYDDGTFETFSPR